jgi:sigma-54 specific flagellar transcriptional regulator A
MPLPMQLKLLRVIQDRKIDRVGSNSSINVDVRLIAATNKNLEELIQSHLFREDLYYRLNVFPIQVPSLSERPEDIPLLIDYHLDKMHDRLKHRVVFSERAKEIVCNYAWPGNIRELQNFLERMVILYPDQVIDEHHIDDTYKQKKSSFSSAISHFPSEAAINIKEYIANVEQQVIKVALEKSNGAIHAAAEYLSLGKAALLEKMKKYNLT